MCAGEPLALALRSDAVRRLRSITIILLELDDSVGLRPIAERLRLAIRIVLGGRIEMSKHLQTRLKRPNRAWFGRLRQVFTADSSLSIHDLIEANSAGRILKHVRHRHDRGGSAIAASTMRVEERV